MTGSVTMLCYLTFRCKSTSNPHVTSLANIARCHNLHRNVWSNSSISIYLVIFKLAGIICSISKLKNTELQRICEHLKDTPINFLRLSWHSSLEHCCWIVSLTVYLLCKHIKNNWYLYKNCLISDYFPVLPRT